MYPRQNTAIIAAIGLLLYLLTVIADIVSIAIRYWIGNTLGQIVISATAPASAQTFPFYVVGLIFAFAPVAWGMIALIGLPSGSTLARYELGGRAPNTQERETVERALAELLSIHPGIRRPRTWLVSSTIQPDTIAIGTTLYINSSLLQMDRKYLTASLAHALGHLNTLDSRLIEAIKRLKIEVVSFLVYALDSLSLGSFSRRRGLGLAGREAGCFITMLVIVLSLIAGGLGLRITSPLWRFYFHTCEYTADAYAAYLGQGQVLATMVDDLNYPLDVPFTWMWDRTGTSEYTEKRLALLRQQPAISTGPGSW